MSDRAVLKEKNSVNNNKNGEAHHHHHGQAHHSQKEEKEGKSNSKALVENSADTFLKRYKVIEKIGEGSYSEVLKCQNRQDGTLVACKRLKHIYKSWSDVNNIAEIATLRTIQRHSNILQMIEIHYDEALGKVSLVFELMDVNLYELIKDRKRLLPESRVRTIMFQLFRALRHLHKLGIFHRDIKPENILIKTKTDQLKLGDLGSVRGMFSRPPYTEYISTRWYRSPECLLTAGHYSHKMDVWAAGCVFYEVLTLRPLFPGSSEIDQINRINNILGPPPIKLLETFQKQAEMERDTYRGQSQLNRRQQIQKVLDEYSSKYTISDSKNSSNKSIKSNSRNSVEYHFSGREGTGLEKILPSHISREAKEIIKSCLSYDPELRPTAQRVIQLSYFYELRESYNKNPDKVSSKPVLTICGETVTEQNGTIDLATLGDNKMKYRRGHVQRSTKQSTSSYSQSKQNSKQMVDRKSSSHKDVNNNYSKHSSSPNDNSIVSQSRSKLSNGEGRGMSKSSKVGSTGFLIQKDRKSSVVDHNNNKIMSRRGSQVTVNQMEGVETASKIPSKIRTKNLPNLSRKQKKDSTTLSSSSFDSVHSDEKSKYKSYKYNAGAHSKAGEKSSTFMASQKGSTIVPNQIGDTQVSPYVKAPSELKFLQKKIRNDRKGGGGAGGQTNATISPMKDAKGPCVPPKVAAAALKFVKTHQSKSSHYRQSERTNVGGSSGVLTPPEEQQASVKIGKLRFRHKQQVPLKQEVSSPDDKPHPPQPQPVQQPRSRIPLYIEDPAGVVPSARSQSKQAMYRTTKLTSPAEKERDTTDKWRNTGIPRIVMSPERERNIRLLRESLTIDKNKRLKIRRLEQDAMNSNNDADVESNIQLGIKTTPNRNPNFDYTSQDTIGSSNGPRPGHRLSGATYSSGRYRNSTTDYENPDLQDTSSSAAAPVPDSRNMYVTGSARKRIVVAPEDMMKKPVQMKKSSNLYPPEILNLYSSRFRGPDVNMNILKDQGSYVKHSDRTQEVKEKLNQKLELRRRQQLNSSSVGDHPSKLASERSSVFMNEYGQYSTCVTGGTIPEEQAYSRSTIQTGNKSGRIERRPPIPPGKGVMGMRNTEPTKSHHQTFRDPSEENMDARQEGRAPYQSSRRSSMIPGPTSGVMKESRGQKSSRRSVGNVPTPDQVVRKEFKEQTKRRVDRMRSTMRDDVFCSSDDDVVITMRKKFDVLISERARKLSESLKTNPLASESKSPEVRKYYDSDEDAITPPIDSRAKNTANEKARKYARRELRARMAESLTMNNLATNHWRLSEHRAGPMLIENPSNNSGDYVVAAPSYEKGPVGELGNKKYQPPPPQPQAVDKSSYSHHGYMRQRKDLQQSRGNNNEYREKYMEQTHPRQPPVSSRIYPFSRHEQNTRHGQIYTPPGNKPVYQAPDVGAMLHERKLRYSHNLQVPISNTQSNYSQRGRNIKEDMKKRQRI